MPPVTVVRFPDVCNASDLARASYGASVKNTESTSFCAKDAWFSSDDCEIICVGRLGELVAIDASSAAVLCSVPACMDEYSAGLTARGQHKGQKHALIVDANGQVLFSRLLLSGLRWNAQIRQIAPRSQL